LQYQLWKEARDAMSWICDRKDKPFLVDLAVSSYILAGASATHRRAEPGAPEHGAKPSPAQQGAQLQALNQLLSVPVLGAVTARNNMSDQNISDNMSVTLRFTVAMNLCDS
jgi:hypothetical protein